VLCGSPREKEWRISIGEGVLYRRTKRGKTAVFEGSGMRPRFVGRVGPADAVTVVNAMVGFLAVAAATVDPRLAARLVLLAAIGDGIDGVVARQFGGSPVGEHLDSLSDVVAFGVAPAVVVAAYAVDAWSLSGDGPLVDSSPELLAAVGLPALFVGMVVLRLGLYSAYDAGNHHTEGVPSTLAATVLAAVVLASAGDAAVLIAGTGVLSYLMVTTITYPDLLARDALIMGAVQGLAVLFPAFAGRAFPYAVLTLALAYLLLSPWFYWRPEGATERY
jgi:CDP-diacylglycerol--serine O-phosphatidyltransferase